MSSRYRYHHYGVVIGVHCTGKSTAMLETARASSIDGVDGAVYYSIDYPVTFTISLGVLLGQAAAKPLLT